jgi:hypothetical protein
MRQLQLMILTGFCLMHLGCGLIDLTVTPAEKAATGDHPNAHLSRGGPRNGYDFIISPSERARWIREIPQIAKGTSVDEVIRRLGEPDQDDVNFEHIFGPVSGRTLTYYLAIYRVIYSSVGKDQLVMLLFSRDNRFEYYLADGGSGICFDMSALVDVGSAASRGPATSRPVR